MTRSLLLIFCALALLLAPAGLAQTDDKPTVAVLRFGPHLMYNLVDQGLLNGMMSVGLVSGEEHRVLAAGGDLAGETLNVHWYDANFNFANANIIVEEAIDAGADVLITYSTPVTQAAVSVTSDMDDPPAVLFASVFDPVAAGIVQSRCIKPDHVTGIESVMQYTDLVPLLRLQKPDIQLIGTLYNSAETSGVVGAGRIIEAAEAQGIAVLERAITNVSDIAIAAESLVDAGVEALLIPADMSTVAALPILMQVAVEFQLPVFHSIANAIADGATVTAGTSEGVPQGRILAYLAQGYLDGARDIARTGVGLISNMIVSVNMDMAQSQGIAISDGLMAVADHYVEDGKLVSARILRILQSAGLDEKAIQLAVTAIQQLQATGVTDVELPPEVMAILQQGFHASGAALDFESLLASLHCTDEMIAEQQAALDAG